MKQQYKEMPESMKGTYGEFSKNFGFNWKEFVMGIPTPMVAECFRILIIYKAAQC